MDVSGGAPIVFMFLKKLLRYGSRCIKARTSIEKWSKTQIQLLLDTKIAIEGNLQIKA
jgi:hypothetical protein